MRGRLLATSLAILCLTFAGGAATAANLSVDRLELMSFGHWDEGLGLFSVDSRLFFGLSIEGGEKFSGLLRLDFLSTEVENDLATLQGDLPAPPTSDLADAINRLNAPGLRVRTAAISAKRLFDGLLEATYFVGSLDSFCSGDDFVPLFGAAPFATELRGPLRFPEGIKVGDTEYDSTISWDGIHAVYGTGFRLGFTLSERSRAYAYVYQDSDLGPGRWSMDFRGLFDRDSLKLEVFGGGSYTKDTSAGLYRGGLLFFASPGDIGEFYAQVGVPRWDPSSTFSAENIFFLFEPRVNFESGSLALSVFYHPKYYRQRETAEAGYLDVGFNLRFGKLAETGAQGGVETYLSLHQGDAAAPVAVELAPYYDMIASGAAWSFKLGIRPMDYGKGWYAMFRPFIGVKTSF